MRPDFSCVLVASLAVALGACADVEDACPPGTETTTGGRCIDPNARYEPDARIDHDNVVAYGDPLTELHLPSPPRSGFRLIAAPRTLDPGEEVETCISWPYPTIERTLVYSARLYATPGLHHSNVIAKPVDTAVGPNPYPECHSGADDPFSKLPAVIPDVLFASSTQVSGVEKIVFPPGIAFRVDPTREISANYHLLNATSQPMRVEVAYDFFTMPEDALENEVAAFAMQVNQFVVPPHATEDIGSTCRTFGGTLVSLMPHYHRFSERFTSDIVTPDGASESLYEDDGFDAASHIVTFDPPRALGDFDSLSFDCRFHNTTEHDLHYGIGENEMCVLFGYLYPVRQQLVAYAPHQGDPCKSFQIGLFR